MIKNLFLTHIISENQDTEKHKKSFPIFTDKVVNGHIYRNIDVSTYTPSIISKFHKNKTSFDFLANTLIIKSRNVASNVILDILEEYDPSTMYGILIRFPNNELVNVMYFKNILEFLSVVKNNPHIKSWEVQTFEYIDVNAVNVFNGNTRETNLTNLRNLMTSAMATTDKVIDPIHTYDGITNITKFKEMLYNIETFHSLGSYELLHHTYDPIEIKNREIFVPVDKIVGNMIIPYYGALSITNNGSSLYGRNLSYNFLSGNINQHKSMSTNGNEPYLILNNDQYFIDEKSTYTRSAFTEWFNNNYRGAYMDPDILFTYIGRHLKTSPYGNGQEVKLYNSDDYYKIFTSDVCMGTNSSHLEHLDRLNTLNSTSAYYATYLKMDFYMEATEHQKCSQRILKKARKWLQNSDEKKEVEPKQEVS